MLELKDREKLVPGTRLTATWVQNIYNMTEGKEYEVVRVEDGIFSNRPYIVVVDDRGKKTWLHFHRFSFKTEGI